ncbi:hypothetical protein RFI_35772, partial [Reticulomyxa filosa]
IGKYEREIDNKGVGYIFDILNAPRAEKVLHYLKKCKETTFSFTDIVTVNDQSVEKKQSTLRQDLAAILCLIERYLQCYGEFVQNQLRSLDYTEISSALDTDTNEFMEKVEVIVNRLYEINKLEKNHHVIFAFFPQDMMKQFHSKLENIWWNLSDDMMKLEKQSNLPELKSKLFVIKTLIALDDYTKPNCKFRDLFFKHQEALFNNIIDTSKVFKAMDEHRYIDVAAQMFKINQRKDGDVQVERAFEELKNSLSRSLRALAKTTMMKVLTLGDNEVDLENAINLEAQLQAIEDAKNYVFDYVGENTMKEIEKIESETKSSIERWLFKVVAIVKAAINCYNFEEAEEKIKLIRKFTRILGNRFEQTSFDDNKEEKTKEETDKISNSIDQLERQLQKVLEEVIEKYKKINLKTSDFNPYASNPPKNLYTKLEKVMHTASTYNYKESWDAVEEDITQKVREQLQEVRKQVKDLNSREVEARIRVCESVLNSLPKHMQEILKEEIKQCHDDIKCDLEHSSKEVEQVIQKKNAQEIKELLSRSTQSQKKKIELGVDKIVQDIVSRMDRQWTEEDTEGALKNFVELACFTNTLKSEVDLGRYFSNARNNLENMFNKYQKNIITNFDSLDQDTSTLKWMEKAFTFIISCIELKTANGINANALLPSNFNIKIKELDDKTWDYFASFQERYKKSLNATHAAELNTVLNTLKIVGSEGPFLQKVRIFMRKKVECGIPEDFPTRKFFQYSEMILDLNVHLENMVDDITNEGIVNGKTKNSDVERDRYFSQLREKIDFLKQVSQWKSYITNPQKLTSYESALEKEVEGLMNRIREITKWSREDCSQIVQCYYCFISMKKNGILLGVVKSQIDAIDRMVQDRVLKLKNEAINNLDIDHIIPHLVSMKMISICIFSFKEMVNKHIDDLLNIYKRQHKDGVSISKLALKLEKDPSGIGETIVAEHNAFKGYNVALFNVKTKSHGVDYVLEKIDGKGDKIMIDRLNRKYVAFEKCYKRLIEENLRESNLNLSILVNNAKRSAGVWTLQNAHFYFDAKGVQDQDSYLLQPHAAQVIAIFRMLGIDENKPGLTNNLVQIGTGEGKSVTLAVTSCVLALLGFGVSCASYSEYLSCRDFKSFESLFNAFGVVDRIHYGTFNKLYERIINEGGDVRRLVEKLIFSDDEKKECY